MYKKQKEKAPITPEKQEYLNRQAKRKKTLAKLESCRRVKKIGITYKPTGGDAPCAFMVERIKHEQEEN